MFIDTGPENHDHAVSGFPPCPLRPKIAANSFFESVSGIKCKVGVINLHGVTQDSKVIHTIQANIEVC